MTDDLVAFLKARLDDAVRASWQAPSNQDGVLRDIEAKRRIIVRYEAAEERADGQLCNGMSLEADDEVADRLALEWVVRQLAAVFAGHPDYRAEWAPPT